MNKTRYKIATLTGLSLIHIQMCIRDSLRGVQRNEIERGQVLAKPGTLTCHTKFTAQVYVLTKDEGGRHTPFFNNYRPQFYFRTTDVTGVDVYKRQVYRQQK